MLAPAHFPRHVRLGLYALASGILLAMCLVPQDELPQPGIGDKPEHAIAWFVLTVTGYVLAPRRRWAIPAYAVAFGVLVEVLQGLMGFGRDADWRDVVGDSVGVAAGVAGYFAVRAWRCRR